MTTFAAIGSNAVCGGRSRAARARCDDGRLARLHAAGLDAAQHPGLCHRPRHDPPLPLVISPHGRGVDASANAQLWGDLPGRGGFAVINPEGQGRKLELYSWGDPGQIADLARMPTVLEHALPWVHVDRSRIYAVGGSMGGQEALLLVARYPHLLAGAITFDVASTALGAGNAIPGTTVTRFVATITADKLKPSNCSDTRVRSHGRTTAPGWRSAFQVRSPATMRPRSRSPPRW